MVALYKKLNVKNCIVVPKSEWKITAVSMSDYRSYHLSQYIDFYNDYQYYLKCKNHTKHWKFGDKSKISLSMKFSEQSFRKNLYQNEFDYLLEEICNLCRPSDCHLMRYGIRKFFCIFWGILTLQRLSNVMPIFVNQLLKE